MKNIRIKFILVLLMLAACTKEESLAPEFSLNSFGFSECKYEKGAFVNGGESMEYRYAEGNLLSLKHVNVYFNCCQAEKNLTVETQMIADSIIVNEFEKAPGLCDCICPYNMECTVGPLQEKQYWIIVKKGGNESFRFLIDFKEELEGVKSL